MKNSVYTSDGSSRPHTKAEELSEVIEDLELSLEVNKSLFKDIIFSKKSNKSQNSEDSDANLLISSRSLEIVQSENNRVSEAISRMKKEMLNAENLISISQERSKQSRVRRKESHSKLLATLKDLKESVQKKEEEIRQLENYTSNLEMLLSKTSVNDAYSPEQVIKEGKKVIKKVFKQLETAEIARDEELRKCRDIEIEIKKIESAVKIGTPQISTNTDKILNKNYSLNLNYENFWFVGSGNIEDVSDSIRSSASSVQDQQFPNKFEFSSKLKPKIPKLKFPATNPIQNPKKDSPESKINRLELAYQIKCEETQSLIRILNDLRAIESSLIKGLEIKN
jgi:hypothetical protein